MDNTNSQERLETRAATGGTVSRLAGREWLISWMLTGSVMLLRKQERDLTDERRNAQIETELL
jgi:hypothetical protein